MQGHRIPDSTWFERHNKGTLKPGDYGVEFITKTIDGEEVEHRDWFVCCPNGQTTVLWVNEDDRNGSRHVITEHEDGTISVGGSILGSYVPAENITGGPITSGEWHGHLIRGEWSDVD